MRLFGHGFISSMLAKNEYPNSRILLGLGQLAHSSVQTPRGSSLGVPAPCTCSERLGHGMRFRCTCGTNEASISALQSQNVESHIVSHSIFVRPRALSAGGSWVGGVCASAPARMPNACLRVMSHHIETAIHDHDTSHTASSFAHALPDVCPVRGAVASLGRRTPRWRQCASSLPPLVCHGLPVPFLICLVNLAKRPRHSRDTARELGGRHVRIEHHFEVADMSEHSDV